MEDWESSQKERFEAILGKDVSKLLRESSTEFNFLEVKDKVASVREHVNLIATNYGFWLELPENKRSSINNALADMITQFDAMEKFDPKQNNAWDFRNNLVSDFQNRYNGFYEQVITPLNSYLGRKAYSQELAGKFGQEAKKELTEIRRVKKEIEDVQTQVHDAATIAGDVASTAHAIAFSEQAVEHARDAKKWLIAVCVFAGIAFLIALSVAVEVIREISDTGFKGSVEAYVLKVAVLAFLYLGIRFTVKNYSAHQHLYIINKQRSNILKSMEAFRSSGASEQTKDSVLLAAVGAAFTHQETGFITTKEGAGTDDAELMNIVKAATGK